MGQTIDKKCAYVETLIINIELLKYVCLCCNDGQLASLSNAPEEHIIQIGSLKKKEHYPDRFSSNLLVICWPFRG